MIIQDKIKKKSEEYGQLSAVFIKGAEYVLNNQWVSVDEDLPCNYPNNIHFGFTDSVIATDGKNVFNLYMKKYKDDKWIWGDDNVIFHSITH